MLTPRFCCCCRQVGRALSSSSGSKEALQTLRDARVIYQGIAGASQSKAQSHTKSEGESVSTFEVEYASRLLGGGQDPANIAREGRVSSLVARASAESSPTGSDYPLARHLAAARTALGKGSEAVAIGRYKEAIRAQPTALVGWRELAAYYEVSNQHRASVAALECGARTACSDKNTKSARGAPLYLQLSASKFSMGQNEESLALVSDAFRFGKGGAAGHVLRGLNSQHLGKATLATQGFRKATEEDPTIAALVENIAQSQAPTEAVETA